MNKIINKKPRHNSTLARAKIKKLKEILSVSSFIAPQKIVKQYKISQTISEYKIKFKKLKVLNKKQKKLIQKKKVQKWSHVCILLIYYNSTVSFCKKTTCSDNMLKKASVYPSTGKSFNKGASVFV